MNLNLIFLIMFSTCSLVETNAQIEGMKEVTIRKMIVKWHYDQDRIYFEMFAPTDGWVTIGFNSTTSMTGAYLLMGNVINGKANLVEHYTSSPGNYNPITDNGAAVSVKDVSGMENTKGTKIAFSLPIKALSAFQKELTEGLTYNMIFAYSREDDFSHHSMMRTSKQVKL